MFYVRNQWYDISCATLYLQVVIWTEELVIYQPDVINIMHYTLLYPEITYALNEHFTLFITTAIRATVHINYATGTGKILSVVLICLHNINSTI